MPHYQAHNPAAHHPAGHQAPIHRPILHPINPGFIPGRSGLAGLGTRTATPVPLAVHQTTQRLIDRVHQETGNNPQAVMLIQSGLPRVARIEADFPGLEFTVTPATSGPSKVLDTLNKAIRYKPAKNQPAIRPDVMGLQGLDQSLRGFGVQFTEVPTSDGGGIIPGR